MQHFKRIVLFNRSMKATRYRITLTEVTRTLQAGCVSSVVPGIRKNRISSLFNTTGMYTTERSRIFHVAQSCLCGMTRSIPCTWEFPWEWKWALCTFPPPPQHSVSQQSVSQGQSDNWSVSQSVRQFVHSQLVSQGDRQMKSQMVSLLCRESVTLVPEVFLDFSLRRRSRASREAAITSCESDEEREKNLWLPWPRISLSCRRQLLNASNC